MNSTAIYRAAVSELEKVLPPRVVSRLLRDGMAELGTSADRLTLVELRSILDSRVRRQLLASLPREQVEESLARIGQRLEGAASGEHLEPHSLLESLRAEMKPFNLYFEWPEVQELRSRLQQLESDVKGGRPPGESAARARQLLRQLNERLDELLAAQAEELARLENLFSNLTGAGGGKARRLEHLIAQIQEAQRQRQLATAELQRAWQLASDVQAAPSGPPTDPAGGVSRGRGEQGDGERLSELAELRSLEREASRFAGQGLPGYERLRELLDEALLEGPGEHLQRLLEAAWRQLEELRGRSPSGATSPAPEPATAGPAAAELAPAQAPAEPEGVEGQDLGERLAAARRRLAGVEKLNSDGVELVRSRLRALEGRLGDGTGDHGLASELAQLESLLEGLEAEHRATREVAGALVGGGLEDVLGLFDEASQAPADSSCGDDRTVVSRTLKSLEDTRDLAFELAERLPEGGLLILSGPLGAGKTTLTGYLARALGSDAGVSSPTYTLVHEYPGVLGTLVHIDAYRLAGTEMKSRFDLDDYLERARLVVVEWGESLAEEYPEAWLLRLDRRGEDRYAELCRPEVAAGR